VVVDTALSVKVVDVTRIVLEIGALEMQTLTTHIALAAAFAFTQPCAMTTPADTALPARRANAALIATSTGALEMQARTTHIVLAAVHVFT